MTHNIKDIGIEALEHLVRGMGWRSYTRDQLISWLYRKGVHSFDEMTNLARDVKQTLVEQFSIGTVVKQDESVAPDGTRKFLFAFPDGKTVESVLMPQPGRVTLCVSTQVGCAMGCKFCKTAEMGLVRNLTLGEILEQVIEANRLSDRRVTNIVMMGMGEPLHNYNNVVEACRILIDRRAFALAPKRVTVSTVGLSNKIAQFHQDVPVKLAISLNATTDAIREQIMPVNKAHPLADLLGVLKKIPMKKRDRFTFEYVLFKDLNDTLEDARRLVKILNGIPAKINLIPYNEYPGSPYQRPTLESIERFFHAVADSKLQVNIRWSKGDQIMAGCGQLATVGRAGGRAITR